MVAAARQPCCNLRAPTCLRVSARTRLAGPKPDSEGAAASRRAAARRPLPSHCEHRCRLGLLSVGAARRPQTRTATRQLPGVRLRRPGPGLRLSRSQSLRRPSRPLLRATCTLCQRAETFPSQVDSADHDTGGLNSVTVTAIMVPASAEPRAGPGIGDSDPAAAEATAGISTNSGTSTWTKRDPLPS